MRKYYKPSDIRKRGSEAKIGHTVCPWSLLESYVIDSACYYSWDDLCALMSCITHKSVKGYLSISSRLDSYAQKYTGKEDVAQVFAHRQAATLLKKYPFKDSDLDCDPLTTALNKMLECEEQCRETNKRLRETAVLPSWINLAQKRCADVLGELSASTVMKIIGDGKHGPGATLSSKQDRVTSYYKYSDTPYSVSKSAKPYAYAAISLDPKWTEYLSSKAHQSWVTTIGPSQLYQKEISIYNQVIEVENSDRVTFVPKDCRTDRPIAVGASLNMFLQLGVKSYLEKRLKTVGVNLTDQSKNREFAFLGSAYSSLNDTPNIKQFSTIDLASASDTISIELIKLILPSEWYSFLDDLRHKTGTLPDGSTITYEKFSSMGNGFTFPLESLIFYCISYGAILDSNQPCTYNDMAVYGDDIIVRNFVSSTVISALEWSGFSINLEKSFISGPFKESCGKDYFQGHLVRPFYLKREICSYEDIYFTCNSINHKTICTNYTTTYNTMYYQLLKLIKQKDLNYGPIGVTTAYQRDINDYVNIADSYLCVPLSFMTKLGIRPWLSQNEEHALRRSKLLTHSGDYQGMYVISTIKRAKSYRANSSVLYMMHLRNTCDSEDNIIFDYESKVTVLSKAPTSHACRRNSYEYVTKVQPIPSWDGQLSRSELYCSLLQ